MVEVETGITGSFSDLGTGTVTVAGNKLARCITLLIFLAK